VRNVFRAERVELAAGLGGDGVEIFLKSNSTCRIARIRGATDQWCES
jgi:hypothetical protein